MRSAGAKENKGRSVLQNLCAIQLKKKQTKKNKQKNIGNKSLSGSMQFS